MEREYCHAKQDPEKYRKFLEDIAIGTLSYDFTRDPSIIPPRLFDELAQSLLFDQFRCKPKDEASQMSEDSVFFWTGAAFHTLAYLDPSRATTELLHALSDAFDKETETWKRIKLMDALSMVARKRPDLADEDFVMRMHMIAQLETRSNIREAAEKAIAGWKPGAAVAKQNGLSL